MISAVVCTYNRERFLEECLESIANQTLGQQYFEIIIINNNSTDRTEAISKTYIDKYPDLNIYYFIETNQGLSYARNRGVKESKGDLITFIDDDATLDKNFLEQSYQFFKLQPEVEAIGGKILLNFEDTPPKWYNIYLSPLLGYFNMGDKVKRFPKNNYPRGSNMTFRARVFEKYGMFNTELGRKGENLEGGEEKDIFSRLHKQNESVYYVPEAIVHHAVPVERTTQEFIRKQAFGTGVSERNRIKNSGFSVKLRKIISELWKWSASILLFVLSLLGLNPTKGVMIIFWKSFYLITHIKIA